jgi:hypothetical protein
MLEWLGERHSDSNVSKRTVFAGAVDQTFAQRRVKPRTLAELTAAAARAIIEALP